MADPIVILDPIVPPFRDGISDQNDKLNALYYAYAAGPYNSLPLTGGTVSGLTTFSAGIALGVALPISSGGTGSITAATARTVLSVPEAAATAAALALKFSTSGGDISGNVNLTSGTPRINANYSTDNPFSRAIFQTSTANGYTLVTAMPNGTSAVSGFMALGTSDLSGNVGSHMRMLTATGESRLESGALGGGGTIQPLTFVTNGEVMRLDASRNLLFGTTTAGDPVAVRVNGLRVDGTTKSVQVRSTSPHEFGITTPSGTHVIFYTDSGSSYVGAGSITSNGSTTSYGTSSDYRLKNDVANLTGSLDYIAQLRPVGWTWADGSVGEGFLAHEAQAVCPQAVTGVKDAMKPMTRYVEENGEWVPVTAMEPDYQGMDSSYLIGRMVGAIQELEAQLADAVARIEALENPVAPA